MQELDNCANCGKLFVRTTRTICRECYKEEERQYEIVYNFLKQRANREATIPEIVESTGVKESLIIKFVREKRLRSSQFPNLSYPCDRCGDPIEEGMLCSKCTRELAEDLRQDSTLR